MATTPKVTSGPPAAYQPVLQPDYGSLPNVILLHLFSFLDIKNLMAASLANKHWNRWAEHESTVLGKVKRAFRIFNGPCQIEGLSPPDQSYRALRHPETSEMEYFLSKKENGTVTRIKITEPKAQLHRTFPQDPSASHFWVSKTLFVSKVDVNFYSNQIDYENMTIVSSDLPAFPAPVEEQHEISGFWQKQEFLEVGIKTPTALHTLKYLIDEKSGPAKFYLGELKHHIVCQLTLRNDANPPYEELTSIAKIEKEHDREVVKWSQTRNNDRFRTLTMDGKWLVLTCGRRLSELRYHFINVSSGEEKYTYAPPAVPCFEDLVSINPVTNKENICLIAYTAWTNQGKIFTTAKILELEARQSIPLSDNAKQVLSSFKLFSGNEMKFEWNQTQEGSFFKIEGSSIAGHDYQIKFSGNPNVPLTSFPQLNPLYVSFVNFMDSIKEKIIRLGIFHPVAFIVIVLIFPLIFLLLLYAVLRNLKK